MRSIIVVVGALTMLSTAACSDTVTPPPGTPVTINWSPCFNDPNAPTWFAYQDGNGAWTRVTPVTGVFTFVVSSGRAGVATYVNGELDVLYATTAELSAYRPSCTGSTRAVSGSVAGYVSADDINIEMSGGSASISGTSPAPATFQLGNVRPGAVDVLAMKSRSTATTSTFQLTPSAVFIRRAQSGNAIATIDLNSTTESSAPVVRTVTVANAANNEDLFVSSMLATPTSSLTLSKYEISLGTVSGNVSALYYGLPASKLVAGETQAVTAITSRTISSTVSEGRYVINAFADAIDQTISMGAALGTVTVTGGSRPAASYTIQTGYDQIFEFDLDQAALLGGTKAIQVKTTRAYAGAGATVILAVPDLTGAGGFQTAWLMTPGTPGTWTFYAGNATLGTFESFPQSFTAASRTSAFTP